MTRKAEKTIDCIDRERMSVYIDGCLSERDEAAVAAHLHGCGDCLAELNLQKELLGAIERIFHEVPPPAVPEGFANAVKTVADSEVRGLRSRSVRIGAALAVVWIHPCNLSIFDSRTCRDFHHPLGSLPPSSFQ